MLALFDHGHIVKLTSSHPNVTDQPGYDTYPGVMQMLQYNWFGAAMGGFHVLDIKSPYPDVDHPRDVEVGFASNPHFMIVTVVVLGSPLGVETFYSWHALSDDLAQFAPDEMGTFFRLRLMGPKGIVQVRDLSLPDEIQRFVVCEIKKQIANPISKRRRGLAEDAFCRRWKTIGEAHAMATHKWLIPGARKP